MSADRKTMPLSREDLLEEQVAFLTQVVAALVKSSFNCGPMPWPSVEYLGKSYTEKEILEKLAI
jgi:hypothetical protein